MDARPDKAGRLPVLILGGTTEASALVLALAPHAERFDVTLSLAGRTRSPKSEPVRTRIGGFGGADGLVAWIDGHGITRVIDATHPFAARISRNAALACARCEVPLLAIRRPAWERVEGDRWIEVDDMAAAAAALGAEPRRVVLTIGRQELAAFASAPHHDYLARTIEPVAGTVSLPRLTEISARGPFAVEDEIAFLRGAGAEVLVSKHSGGAATYAKIVAARELGLPVVIVRRPEVPDVLSVADTEGALAWLTGSLETTSSLRAQRSNPEPTR